ncbi:MAG: dipeptide/oligopeptide/nickel ABC transporter ATP-binding protein [Oscillospiraceae bacterium]|nr:dipeptide/oligopeptide/nickel ABC transporter ATP-binding protein [Oscillospiraceae bacterium]
MINVHDLKKSFYPKRGSSEIIHAVRGVSFTIKPGEVLGLIGPSGCGKSTVARLIAGLIQPDEGSAESVGRIGFVSQDPYSAISPVMRVGNIVAEPLRWRKNKSADDLTAVSTALEKVKLDYDKFKNRLPRELSGGERQRVSLARAFIAAEGVLILDEPVSMLDYDVKLEITDILRGLVMDSGCAVLLISHDISFVREMATHIVVMQQGLIIETGTPEQICGNPQ